MPYQYGMDAIYRVEISADTFHESFRRFKAIIHFVQFVGRDWSPAKGNFDAMMSMVSYKYFRSCSIFHSNATIANVIQLRFYVGRYFNACII